MSCKFHFQNPFSKISSPASLTMLPTKNKCISTIMLWCCNFPFGMLGHVNAKTFIFFYLQVIIPFTWIFALIFAMSGLVLQGFGKELAVRSCDLYWTNQKLKLVYNSIWLTHICIFLILMVGLYSSVVYTLWFKPRGDNEVTNQQV